MKKVIYSIVTALIVSVIFALFVPRLLFKGDALWTYQNDASRVDILFDGYLKKGRVRAEGTDLKTSQPGWLSDHRFQGTVVDIPISYRTKSYRIRLTPEAEVWGEDAVLIMEFKGNVLWHRGKSVPAMVRFRNVTLNGQLLAGEKVVRYDKPLVLKYPPHSSPGITLTFDVCKPFAASDIAFVNLLVVFLTFLLISLLFSFPQTVARYIPKFFYRRDILSFIRRHISDGYSRIDPVYRRSFWIVFGTVCCAFGLHTIWFMWGNHEWALLSHTQRWLHNASQGRYMWGSIKMIFSSGVYLPIIYDLITFITLALNAVLLCMYWRLERRVVYFVICGLILTVQPFTLSMMYYVNMIPEIFIGMTFVVTALLLSEKVATGGGYIILKFVYSFLSVVLINFALAMYPVCISTIAVAFVGRLLVQSFHWDGSRGQLKSYVRPYVISTTHIMLGIALYKLIITFVFPVQSTGWNTDTLPLAQVPERLSILLKQSFHQLYEYDMPFLPQWILWVFMGFTIMLALYACSTGNCKQKIVRLSLLFASLFATQTAMIIAKNHVIEGRVDLFGLVFYEALVTMLFITRFRKLRNLSVIVGACVIFSSILNDWDCLRVWKIAFDAEKMHWNRVLTRLEMQKGFDPSKKYNVVQVGKAISMRPRYYTGEKTHSFSSLFSQGYDPNFSVFSAHEFYYPTRFRRRGISGGPDYIAQLRRLYQAGVLQKAEVWPKPNGLIVWKDIILFVTDRNELNNYRKKFEREQGKK